MTSVRTRWFLAAIVAVAVALALLPHLPPAQAATGDSWTARTGGNDNVAVAFGNGLFVTVTSSGADQVATSPDGVTWTSRNTPGSDINWSSVTYGNGLFVALAQNNPSAPSNSKVMTSPDGIKWTLRSTPGAADVDWTSVAYGNGRFVAVSWQASASDQVMSSTDGITWSLVPVPTPDTENGWQAVTYGAGQFVAVQNEDGAVVLTSPDGINWTKRTGIGQNWDSVTYGGGKFVAVGQGSTNYVMTSSDGVTWTGHPGVPGVWFGVAYGAGRFIAVSLVNKNPGVWLMTSPDGVNWSPLTAAAANGGGWRGITYVNDIFVAVGQGESNQIMTSGILHNQPDPDHPHAPDLSVTARHKGKKLKPNRQTKVVKAVNTDGTIHKIKVKCKLKGTNLKGAAKKRACRYKIKNLDTTAIVKVKAKCTVGHRIQVKIVAKNDVGTTTWVQGWGVKNKPKIRCAVSGNG